MNANAKMKKRVKIMTDLESLKAERKALEQDFKKFGDKLNDWSHDLFLSRLEMVESMIGYEQNGV